MKTMQRRFWRPVMAAALTLCLGGCAHVMAYNDAVADEKRGDPLGAASHAARAVNITADYPEARALWDRVWPLALADVLARTDAAEAKGDWEGAIALLERLDEVAQSAGRAGLAAPIAPIAERLNANRHQAADLYYNRGLALEKDGRLKDAAVNFRYTGKFVANFKDSQARYHKDREAAIVRVAVLPFDNESGYPGVAAMLSDKLLEAVLKHQGEFVTYVDRQYLTTVIKEASLQASGLVDPETAVRLGKLAGVRYLVVGKVTQTQATSPQQRVLRQDAARVVWGAQGRDIPVSITFSRHTQTHQVLVTGSLQIIDVADGAVITVQSLTENKADTAEWIDDVMGDERALDATTGHLRYTAHYPKSHAQLLSEATDALSRRFAEIVTRQFD